jgi:L-rhamnonate dehydratase
LTKITSLNLYLVDTAGADLGPGNTWNAKTFKAHPLSIFPEYKTVNTRTWMGPSAYRPVVVELETDSRVTGFAINHGGGAASAALIHSAFRQFVEGASPFDSNKIWELMCRTQQSTDQGGIAYMAMSAIDLALWDLRGKLLDKPVYDLAGGKTKGPIHCYVTTHPTIMEYMANKGFRGVKMSCPWGPVDGREGMDNIEQMVIKARDLFGGTASLMIECYMGWNRDFTVKMAERLRKYEIDWIEDPLLGDAAISSYRDIRNCIKPTQLAIGNLMWGDNRFHTLINEDGADVIQPELQWAGGMTAALRIAAMARPRNLPVILHSAGVYSYHFTMSQIESPYAEYYVPGDGTKVIPKRHAIIGEPAPDNGYITLSDKPGFGIELERSLLRPFS